MQHPSEAHLMEATRREKMSPSDGDTERCRAEQTPPGHSSAFAQGFAAHNKRLIPAVRAQGCNPNPALTYYRVRTNPTPH